MKEEIFISIMMIFIIFNGLYLMVNPEITNVMLIGGLTSMVLSVAGVMTLIGIQVAGSGLDSTVIKFVLTTLILFNILFRIDIQGFTYGIGLATNIIAIFPPSDGAFQYIGYTLSFTLSIIAFICAMMMVAESA